MSGILTDDFVRFVVICLVTPLVIAGVSWPILAASLRKEARRLMAHLDRSGVTVVPLSAGGPTYRALSALGAAAGSAFADNAIRTRVLAMMIGDEGLSIWKSGGVPEHLLSIPADRIRRVEVRGGFLGNRIVLTVAHAGGSWAEVPLVPISFRGFTEIPGKPELQSIAATLPVPTPR